MRKRCNLRVRHFSYAGPRLATWAGTLQQPLRPALVPAGSSAMSATGEGSRVATPGQGAGRGGAWAPLHVLRRRASRRWRRRRKSAVPFSKRSRLLSLFPRRYFRRPLRLRPPGPAPNRVGSGTYFTVGSDRDGGVAAREPWKRSRLKPWQPCSGRGLTARRSAGVSSDRSRSCGPLGLRRP